MVRPKMGLTRRSRVVNVSISQLVNVPISRGVNESIRQ